MKYPKLEPDRPPSIHFDAILPTAASLSDQQILQEILAEQTILLTGRFSRGLKVLKLLKNHLKHTYPSTSYDSQRSFRTEYHKFSHHLICKIANHKLCTANSPKIGWLKILYPELLEFYLSFPDIQGLNSSWQWYRKGYSIELLDMKIHPYYGVYFPTRLDHIKLFDEYLMNYTGRKHHAIDIGIGSGILSFQLLKHGFQKVVGTDTNRNAIIGVREEKSRYGITDELTAMHGDLFSPIDEQSELIVFNPPWLKASHPIKSGIDKAIYAKEGLFPAFFEQAKQHLQPNGRLVMLFSNLTETIGKGRHPIKVELKNNERFRKVDIIKKQISRGSNRTRRRNWRKHEKTELWILGHS